MSDRAALLEAIRINPQEDMPRLAYADFLEENPTSDLDLATVEFIRLSCDMQFGGRQRWKPMVRAAYPWIEKNWRRLVPSVLAIHTRPSSDGIARPLGIVNGRYVNVYIAPDGCRIKSYMLELEFYLGFVSRVVYCCNTLAAHIRQALLADQPIVKWRHATATAYSA